MTWDGLPLIIVVCALEMFIRMDRPDHAFNLGSTTTDD